MDFPYEMKLSSAKGANPAIVTVRVKVDPKKGGPAEAMKFANSATLRQAVYDDRHQFGLADFGLSNAGAPHVETESAKDGSRVAVAYVREFKFTRKV